MAASSAAVLAAAKEHRELAPPDKLEEINVQVRRARDLTIEIAGMQESLSEKKKLHYEILNKTLPDLMQEARVKSVGLQAEGNYPAFVAQVQPYIHANIAADWPQEKRDAAFTYLQGKGLGDMIKNILTIEFGRGTSKMQTAVLAALNKLKVPFKCERDVPWNTLTAYVKEEIKEGRSVPLDTLGATVGTIVRLKEDK